MCLRPGNDTVLGLKLKTAPFTLVVSHTSDCVTVTALAAPLPLNVVLLLGDTPPLKLPLPPLPRARRVRPPRVGGCCWFRW